MSNQHLSCGVTSNFTDAILVTVGTRTLVYFLFKAKDVKMAAADLANMREKKTINVLRYSSIDMTCHQMRLKLKAVSNRSTEISTYPCRMMASHPS